MRDRLLVPVTVALNEYRLRPRPHPVAPPMRHPAAGEGLGG